MKIIFSAFFILVSLIASSQIYYAEYTGISKLRPRVALSVDSGSAGSADMIGLITPAEMVVKYNLRVYASKDYLFCEEEVIEGSLLGISMKGEVFKYFIDIKNLTGYSYSEHLKIKIIPQNAIPQKKHHKVYFLTAIDAPDTAAIYFDVKIPKEITGSMVLLHNTDGVSALKSIYNEFSIITWKSSSFDFDKELRYISQSTFKEVERPFNLIFRAKYQQ